LEASLDEVLGGSGGAGGGSEDIIDTSELQDLLGDGSSDETGTTGSGGQLEAAGTTLTSRLGGDSVHVTDLVTPVTSADGDDGELGSNKSALDWDLDFLGELDTETDVTGVIAHNDDSLKAGALTGLGLLLDGDDLHDLVGEGSLSFLDELVDDGCLFDGDGVSVDFLKSGDVSVLNETTKLGGRSPIVLATAEATTASATATVTATTSTAATITTATESTTSTAAFLLNGCWTFHLYFWSVY
jgi:hypothetical protein